MRSKIPFRAVDFVNLHNINNLKTKTMAKKIKVGSVVKHKTAGYTAKVKKLYKNGNGILTVTKATGDFGKHVPFDINAKDVERCFE